ncbi:MAG: HAD family phosphatase, partial [Planctomycetes bacterium]|nr:HAD family phosphatase [Planctomycetota bacterium]
MGNVLVHFSHSRMCAQMGRLCGKSGREIQAVVFETGLQDDFERGRIDENEFHSAFARAVDEAVDLPALREAASDIFSVNEPMPAMLDGLHRQGYRLVLLSNTSVWHFQWVSEQFDVLNRFDDKIVSFQTGAIKPEPLIFERALEVIDCDPGECLFTDDIAENVESGRRFGLEGVVFTTAESF